MTRPSAPKPCAWPSKTAATQSLRPAHDRLNPRPALCPQPPARPAQTHPSQPGVGLEHHLFAARQRLLGLSVCLPGRGQQARGGLAGGRCHARRTSHHGLAADVFGATAHPGPARALRPGRSVLRQRLPCPGTPARGRALAKPPGRLLRQRPGREPLVSAQNQGTRTTRVARFCGPGRCAGQCGHLF